MTRLKIENPCEVPWDEMKDVGINKFCGSCSKIVLDLSSMSNEEIIKIVADNKGKKFCGRLYKHQLAQEKSYNVKPFPPTIKKSQFLQIAASAILTIAAPNVAYSQGLNKTQISQTLKRESTSQKENDKIGDDLVIVKGRIINETTMQEMPNASVKLITISKVYSTFSDSKGNFSLEIPKSALSIKNLLYVESSGKYPNAELIVFDEKELKGKISIKMKPEAAFEKMYGEISPNYASEKSLVFLNGKKLEYK